MAHEHKQKKDSFFNLYFTTTISIALLLLTISITAYLGLFTRYMSNRTKEKIAVSLIVADTITPAQQQRLGDYLVKANYVKEETFVTKEEALKEHIEALGDDPTEFLGFNPLKASFEIKLKSNYNHPDSLAWITEKLMAFEGVERLDYEKDMVQNISDNMRKLTLLLLCIAVVLLFISVVLINNTIHISMYSKRFLINTMKLVGAKRSFIRRPFVMRYMLNGLVAAIVALSLLTGLLYYMQHELGESINLFTYELTIPVAVLTIGISLIITFLASFFGINKYLRMKTDDLYYI